MISKEEMNYIKHSIDFQRNFASRMYGEGSMHMNFIETMLCNIEFAVEDCYNTDITKKAEENEN